MVESKRFTLDAVDWHKWGKNTLIFLAPALLVYLLAIQSGSSPSNALVVLELWGLNTLIDITRKFIKE